MITEFLKTGKDNAVPSKVLAKMIGCRNVRDLQTLISQERQQGAVILSTSRNGGGYYLPEDAEEEELTFTSSCPVSGRSCCVAYN